MLTVVVAAPDQRLCTLADLKRKLNITVDEFDEDLDDLIEAASAFISNYTGRTFGRETVVESIAGGGKPYLLLERTPIVSLDEVLYDDFAITAVSIQDDRAGIVFLERGFTDTSLAFNTIDYAPSSYNRLRWHFTYEGGYILPNWEDYAGGAPNLPRDLQQACLELAKSYYVTNKVSISGAAGISSYKVGETSIQFSSGSSNAGDDQLLIGVPVSVRATLNHYRRLV